MLNYDQVMYSSDFSVTLDNQCRPIKFKRSSFMLCSLYKIHVIPILLARNRSIAEINALEYTFLKVLDI